MPVNAYYWVESWFVKTALVLNKDTTWRPVGELFMGEMQAVLKLRKRDNRSEPLLKHWANATILNVMKKERNQQPPQGRDEGIPIYCSKVNLRPDMQWLNLLSADSEGLRGIYKEIQR